MIEVLQILGVLFAILVIGIFASYIDWSFQTKKNIPKNLFDRQRQEANLKILEILTKAANEYPTLRFGQLLRNSGALVDIGVMDSSQEEWETPDYYISREILFEEPQVVLSRIEKTLANEYNYDIVIKVKKK